MSRSGGRMILKILMVVLASGVAVNAFRRPLTKAERIYLKEAVNSMKLEPVIKILSGYADVFPNKTRYKIKYDTLNEAYCYLKLEVWQMPDGSGQVNDDYTRLSCVV